MEFFRHCPQCGRRFHIILEEKKEVDEHNVSGEPAGLEPHQPTNRLATDLAAELWAGGHRLQALVPVESSMELRDAAPNVFNVKEFNYKYRCKHCGHEWTEMRLKEQDLGRVDSRIVVDEKGEID